MKKRNLLAACLGLMLLGTSCASITTRPPGVDGSAYRDWRVTEYRRGHLRPADAEEQARLSYFSAQRIDGLCSSRASYIPGSFCNPQPSHMAITDSVDNGRTRVVEDPTGRLNRGEQRAY